jgi:primosomal protein N'
MEYPPFGELIIANFTSDDEAEAAKAAEEARDFLVEIFGHDCQKRIREPKIASNFKGKEAFRQYIIIKAERSKRNEYVHYLDQFRRKLMSRRSQVNVTIDVDPYSMI